MYRCSECGWEWERVTDACPMCESKYFYAVEGGEVTTVKSGAAVTAGNEMGVCVTHDAEKSGTLTA